MPEIIEKRLSFSGGEWSHFASPRSDLDKYRSSCLTLRNFRPSIYGGAYSRPGTEFIAEQRDHGKKCRLMPFEFNVTTTMILEFGEGYIRFFYTGLFPGQVMEDDGVTPYEIATNYLEEDLDGIQYCQLNDLIYLIHPDRKPVVLARYAPNLWSLEPFVQEWPATLEDNTIPANTIQASGTTGSVTLESPGDIFDPGHVGSRWIIKHRREDPTVSMNLATATQGTNSDPLYVIDDWTASIRSDITGGDYETVILIQRSYDKATWETVKTISSTRASVQVVTTGNELEGCWIRLRYITKTGTPPPALTAEIEATDPTHYGIVEITGFTSVNEVTANVVFELGSTAATRYWAEGAWSDYRGWPRSVTLHEDRLWFGGNSFRPQTVWGSVIDDFGNFRLGNVADIGLSFKASSDAANGIQWISSQEVLLTGTTGSEWHYGNRSQRTSDDPSATFVKRSTSFGSAHIQPVILQDSLLFVQRSGRVVRELAYTFEKDGYQAQDLTLLSGHITTGGIRQISAQKQPESMLWAVTGKGDVVGLVYERGQNVTGWFRYDTQGDFESIAAVAGEGEEDELWVSVRRVIDGQTKRYIERFQPDTIRRIEGGERTRLVYSDCAKIYDGEPTEIISGLDHLEGMVVTVLADGQPIGSDTVLGGEIRLPFASSVVVVGLAYVPELEPTPLETNDPNGISKAGRKRVTRIVMGLWNSLGLEFSGNKGQSWTRNDFSRPTDILGQPVPLFTGTRIGDVEADYEYDATIKIRQTQPLPLNIQHLHIRYDIAIEP